MALLTHRSGVFGFVSPVSRQVTFAARRQHKAEELKPLQMADEDEYTKKDIEETNRFDGEGFAGYLAPYALALLASIAVTGAVFKFVLLDC